MNKINIKSEGNYLDNLKYPGRVKHLEITFSEGESIDWSLNVHNELTTQIGVYAVVRNINNGTEEEEEILYVGLANGKGGLQQRHKTHEKKEQFRLFDASKLRLYYADGPDINDPGKIALLERIMIYGHEPILNDDIKQSKPSTYYVIEATIVRLKYIIGFYKSQKKFGLVIEELGRYETLLHEIETTFETTKILENFFKASCSKDDKKKFKKSFLVLKSYTTNKKLKEANDGYRNVTYFRNIFEQISKRKDDEHA